MQEIFIGRDTKNGIVYKDPSVGGEHLKAIVYDNDEIVIEDLNSTTGTFVDGRRIKRIKLSKESITVKLGNFEITSHTLIKDIKKSMGVGKSDFTELFAIKIAPAFEAYEKKLAKLKSQEYVIQNYRVIATLLGAIITIIAVAVKSETLKISGIAVSAIALVIFTILAYKQKSKLDEKKQDLRGEYLEKIKCPKCRKTLLANDTTLRFLRQRKRCIHTPCDAIFFK